MRVSLARARSPEGEIHDSISQTPLRVRVYARALCMLSVA